MRSCSAIAACMGLAALIAMPAAGQVLKPQALRPVVPADRAHYCANTRRAPPVRIVRKCWPIVNV